jgi:hypothetical protein
MQPADLGVGPWVWIPATRRARRVLPTIIIAIAAASAGYVLGRHSDRAQVASPQKTVAASPQLQPSAMTSKSKAKDKRVNPDLALKVDDIRPPAPSPHPVLLNPDIADTNVQPTRESKRAPSGGGENLRSDLAHNPPRDESAARSRNSMRDYRDLRDYMLRR